MVRLRRLYRDANHCDATSNQQVLDWALKPELWAEHQIRYRNWGWAATEATVRQCRSLSARVCQGADHTGQTPGAFVAGLPFPELLSVIEEDA